MRRFELMDTKSKKFWEVEVKGNTLVVRFGRIGTSGQTRDHVYDSGREAEEESKARIEEKLAKGYHEVKLAGATTEKAKEKTLPAPENGIRYKLVHRTSKQKPQMQMLLVGTQLFTNEDAVQNFSSNKVARDHLERILFIRSKEGYVIGKEEVVSANELNRLVSDDEFELELYVGDHLEIRFTGDGKVSERACKRVLDLVAKEGVRRLDLDCDLGIPSSSWSSAIDGVSFPSMETLIFDSPSRNPTVQMGNTLGDLAATFKAFPNLRRAFLTGSLELSACQHTNLEQLHVIGDPLSASFLAALGKCNFPKLQKLVVLSAWDDRCSLGSVVEAVFGLKAPALKEVHVTGIEDIVDTLDAFATRGIPASWSTLALSLSGPGDMSEANDKRHLQVIRKHQEQFSKLKALALPLEEHVSEQCEEHLTEIVPGLVDAEQFTETLPDAYDDW